MMDEAAYLEWLRENWNFQRFGAFCEEHGYVEARNAYDSSNLDALGHRYLELDSKSIGLPRSLQEFWSILTYPAFGPSFWSNPVKVGIYFREFPLPMWDEKIKQGCPRGCDDLFYGQKRLPSDIMTEELIHISHGHRGYSTLIEGLCVTQKLIDGLFDVDSVKVPDGVVVADVVKLFAPFYSSGVPFETSVSKKSAHRREMYHFAAPLLYEEITVHLALHYVFIFGHVKKPFRDVLSQRAKDTWRIYQPTDGKGNRLPTDSPWSTRAERRRGRWIVLLPHPRAHGAALNKAVKIALEKG